MKEIISYGKYKINVDVKATLKELLDKGVYDTIFPQIHDLELSENKSDTPTEIELDLISIQDDSSFEDMLEEYKKQGYRPATLRELLTFGIQYPEVQVDVLVTSLGTVKIETETYDEVEYKEYMLPCLYSWLTERVVYYAEFDKKYRGKCFFACVKE